MENKHLYLFLKHNSNIICLKLQMICVDLDSVQVGTVPAFLLMKNLTPNWYPRGPSLMKLIKALKN